VLDHAPGDGAVAWHSLWTHLQVGDLNVRRGSLPLARAAYDSGLAIADRLAAADPGNAGWQRDLALSFGRVGHVAFQTGDHTEASALIHRGREIIARLMAASPDNATLPQDLDWFDRMIGQSAGEGGQPAPSSRSARRGWHDRLLGRGGD
jgi:hypothetical protein